MNLNAFQRDRALGSVIASATGDALGASYEFGGPYPASMAIEMRPGNGFAASEWTDDTAMSIPIAQALAAGRDLMDAATQNDIVRAWVEWAVDANDVGIQLRAILQRTRTELNADPQANAAEVCRAHALALHQSKGRSAGNGSLMRIATIPLAYLAVEDGARLTEAVRAISDLTHFESDAGDACVIWAQAIVHAIRTGELDVRVGVEHLPVDRQQRWLDLITEAESKVPSDFEQNGWVVEALQAAWSAIYRTLDTDGIEGASTHLERTLLAAVRGGRDADTVAAIAGSLIGAAYGLSAIPEAWLTGLHGWPTSEAGPMSATDLEALAAQILTAQVSTVR